MPRQKPKNALCRNSSLYETEFVYLLNLWVGGYTAKEAMNEMDKQFSSSIPKGRNHKLRREAITSYFNDFGHYLWVVGAYEACSQLLNENFLSKPVSYPEIDKPITDLIRYCFKTAGKNIDVSTIETDPGIRNAYHYLVEETHVVSMMTWFFQRSNGFSEKYAYGYFARAYFLGAPTTKIGLSFEQMLEVLYHYMIDSMDRLPLRKSFPHGSYKWANDWPKKL